MLIFDQDLELAQGVHKHKLVAPEAVFAYSSLSHLR